MRPKNRLRRLTVPLLFTAAIVLSRLIAVPPLSDPTGAALSHSLHLHTPWLYLILAPLFSLWDGVSMLSMSRLEGFLLGLALLYLLWRLVRNIRPSGECARGVSWLREILTLGIAAALFLAFVISGALWHRPMLSLAGADSNVAVVDFHSHTNASHDVRNTLMRGFDAEANRRWHARAGFDAAFITDHNSVAGFSPKTSKPALCHGIEVSAWRAHIVLLGDSVAVDPRHYNGSMPELLDCSTPASRHTSRSPLRRFRNIAGTTGSGSTSSCVPGSTASKSRTPRPKPTSLTGWNEIASSHWLDRPMCSWSA